jgi:3-hydroxy-9,10-secoandrosta-1,3,5(10)-triene-9,17-dione monooxygenase
MITGSGAAPPLLEGVRKLVPRLAREAAESERLRRPTDAAIRALEESGVFELMVPRRYGGLELDLDVFLEVGLTLARADASLAWVTTFCIEHNWVFCQFPAAFQEELYAEASHVLAPAVVAPSGTATPEGDGFRVRGRWKWGTGVMHATWVILGALTEGGQGPESLRFLALPIADVQVDDTWYVDGMVGTGSNDIVVEDAWVPSKRTVLIQDLVEGRGEGPKLHASPLYRTPMIPILALAASMPTIGQAQLAVDGYREQLGDRVRFGSPRREGEKAAAQARLARAAIEARQAELLLRDVVASVQALRNDAGQEDRARWAASFGHALHQARQVIQDVADGSGASAHFASHPLQRAVRDANVAACHVIFDLDAQRELYGRLLLGLEPTGGIF